MNYHLIGWNGASLSGIRQLLEAEGQRVTGTDERTTGHGPDKLPADVDLVIYSDAITPGSAGWPELAAARDRGLPTQRRIEFIADRMLGHTGIAVAGAHGKSTTTALIGWILAQAGLDPTVFIGADLPQFGGSARSGRGQYVVSEACEWNKQFLALRPEVLVVTTIDREHIDTYPAGVPEIMEHFAQAAMNVAAGGCVIANHDDPLVRHALEGITTSVHWFGRSDQLEYTVRSIEHVPNGTLAITLVVKGNQTQPLISSLVGDHQALNVAAAFAAIDQLGVDRSATAAGIQSFPGLKRRFEVYRDDAQLTVVDDYAHHPAEVAATLVAARQRYPHRRVVSIFQPHLAERTTDLFDEFVAALKRSDLVVVVDSYEPAGRHVRPDAKTSHDLTIALRQAGAQAIDGGTVAATVAHLSGIVAPHDVVITLGATDIWRAAEALTVWQSRARQG